MTLRDKIVEESDLFHKSKLDNLEKIVDEFAIEFAYFIDKYKTYHRVHKSNKQLLEIFKKEKGL